MPLVSAILIAAMTAVPATPAPATAATTNATPAAPADAKVSRTGKKVTPTPTPPAVHEEIVVTANRYEQDSFSTPEPLSVISAEQIERTRPDKVVDMLKQLASVDVQGEGPFRGLPIIRGMSSNRVLILVDGQRLNNARESTQFAGIQPGLVDLGQVERIEVLRGPSSVLYGSDAIGGVVNIITKRQPFGGQFAMNGAVNAEYGSAARSTRGRLDVNGSGEKSTFHLGVTAFEAKNYQSPNGEVPNSGMRQRALEGNVRLLLSDTGVLRLDVQSTQTRDVGFPGYDPKTSGVDIAFPRFDRNKFGATWEQGPWSVFDTLTVSAYVQKVLKEARRNIQMGPTFYSNNFTRSDIDTWGVNAQSTARFGAHTMIVGTDVYQDTLHDETTASNPYSNNNHVAVPDSKQRGIGVFAQDAIALSPRLSLSVGARGDRLTFVSDSDSRYTGTPFDVRETAFSGNTSLLYQATSNVILTALVGRGYRAPNIQERAFFGLASDGTTYIQQNPNLNSEVSLNSEIGFKVRYDRFAGGFNVFHNYVNDFIGLVVIGKDPRGLDLAEFQNFKRATIEGAEFELQAFLDKQWTAFGNISYNRGTDDTTGKPLPLVAPLKAVVGVRLQQKSWWSEASARMVARNTRVAQEVDNSGRGETPGFTVFDVRTGLDLATGFVVQAGVSNLLDKAYHEPYNVRLEPGRSLRLSLGYRF